jgi:predicted SnoaL-like aldol condensation-catalyzing enzyme
MKMKLALAAAAALSFGMTHTPAFADAEPVVGVPDAEALFTSPDPKLNTNLQAAYHIEKDLLQCGQWDKAGNWLTNDYHQHNPNASSGLAGVVYYFTQVLKIQPKPVPEKLGIPIAAVVAQGDYVVVVTPRTIKDPKDPTKSYTTSWFDMWRFKDGKADEHWDPATKN